MPSARYRRYVDTNVAFEEQACEQVIYYGNLNRRQPGVLRMYEHIDWSFKVEDNH